MNVLRVTLPLSEACRTEFTAFYGPGSGCTPERAAAAVQKWLLMHKYSAPLIAVTDWELP